MNLKPLTKKQAERLFDLRNSVIVIGSPLRFRPVIVSGPVAGQYFVMTLGEANKLELA